MKFRIELRIKFRREKSLKKRENIYLRNRRSSSIKVSYEKVTALEPLSLFIWPLGQHIFLM